MTPEELLQAFRLVNPGKFYRELVVIYKTAQAGSSEAGHFIERLADLLEKSRRETPTT